MADKAHPGYDRPAFADCREFITVTPNNPRALDAKQLASVLLDRGMTATACNTVNDGVHLAIERAGSDGIVCALGSLYMLGDVRASLGVQ
jgi:dihydrofolate synthase/folylpolyglutamate synthase